MPISVLGEGRGFNPVLLIKSLLFFIIFVGFKTSAVNHFQNVTRLWHPFLDWSWTEPWNANYLSLSAFITHVFRQASWIYRPLLSALKTKSFMSADKLCIVLQISLDLTVWKIRKMLSIFHESDEWSKLEWMNTPINNMYINSLRDYLTHSLTINAQLKP